MEKIVVEFMTSEDIPNIAKIEKECFSEPWSEKSIEDSLHLSNTYMFVAKDNGIPVGYLITYCMSAEADIANIAVTKDYRKKGIAKMLFNKFFELCRKDEIKTINLEVRESNTIAREFYEKLGFKENGARKRFYTKPSETAILYSLELLN